MYNIKFSIIGVSDSRNQHFSPEVISVLKSNKIFSGGKRHHEIVASLLPQDSIWIDVALPLKNVFEVYILYTDIVIFASGDPLFYGFATTLCREFPKAEITVYPSFNSLQMLAHRLLLPYAEMINISLTGRPWKNLDVALLENRSLIGILTDKKKCPSEIARRLLHYGYDNYNIYVGECLGNDREKVIKLSLQEAADKTFETPNCLILQMSRLRERFFGIPEQMFSHLEGRRNMITKMPVRLLSLAMLSLYDKSVMWDIGFCTGSVAIEAKIHFPTLEIVAFERREESRELLETNCRKFGVPGINGVIADFLDCDLSCYPAPDAVFIGGHGGNLPIMLTRIFTVLNKNGIIVFNSVSDESCSTFIQTVNLAGHKITDIHSLKVDSHNTITIIKAV